MSEARESEVRDVETSPETNRSGSGLLNRFLIYAVAMIGAFLLGFVPMWMTATGRATERDEARRELRLSRIQNSLASATIDARRGEYEPARVATRNFYQDLSAELDREGQGAIPAARRAEVEPLLTDRDDIITLLARSDPSAADRLSNLYATFMRSTSVASPPQSPAR